MKTISVAELHAQLKAQGVPREHLAFVCPRCDTVQSATDLIDAGAGESFQEVEKFLGFSCVGRWTGAGGPRRKPDGNPCNWTLGGFFRLHKMEVETENGEKHPLFEPATPEKARELYEGRAKQ